MALVLHQFAVSIVGDDFPVDALANIPMAKSLIDGELSAHLHASVFDGIDVVVAASECHGQQGDEHELSQVHDDLEWCGDGIRGEEASDAGCFLQNLILQIASEYSTW